MRICLIGASGHVGYVLDELQETGARIVGVSPGSSGEDVHGVYRQAWVYNPQVRLFDHYPLMLDETQPDIAVVACHFADLAQASIASLQRGIHVFTEKPVATTLADLDRLRGAHSKSSAQLAAMLGIRYQPWFLAAWEQVRRGAIGEVRLMAAQKSYKLGIRPPFFQQRESYGGTIPWVGIHAIDWLRWFSGERFLSVFASHSALHNRSHGQLEVTANCHFNMTNEVLASVSIDYLRPDNAPTHDDDRLRVVGTDGIIEVREGNAYLLNAMSDGRQALPLPAPGGIFSDFLGGIRGHGQCLVSAEDSFCATEAALLARQAADRGQLVVFPGTGAPGP